MRRRVIMVGVDCSASSRAALKWALTEAMWTGAEVEAVLDMRAEVPAATDVVETTVVGQATDALVRASRHADLLVLGTRGHGPLLGALLGSVTAHCLRHAECPVVVIPPRAVPH